MRRHQDPSISRPANWDPHPGCRPSSPTGSAPARSSTPSSPNNDEMAIGAIQALKIPPATPTTKVIVQRASMRRRDGPCRDEGRLAEGHRLPERQGPRGRRRGSTTAPEARHRATKVDSMVWGAVRAGHPRTTWTSTCPRTELIRPAGGRARQVPARPVIIPQQ